MRSITQLSFWITMAAIALLSLELSAVAASSTWANAAQLRATETRCGEVRTLTLKKSGIASSKHPAAGCSSTEEAIEQVFVSAKFLPRGNRGPISETDVEVRHVACANEGPMLILGPSADAERALREHRPKPGCRVTTRRYQQLFSAGGIPFSTIPERQTMTVAESLAMGAKERNQIIANCNASSACRAQRNQMSNTPGRSCPTGYSRGSTPNNPYASCVPMSR